ncbi:aminoglycoside phosphotransferase family protein [Methylocaldum sp.]|uniref:phosphotransferase enzyme family protein n=1 Tax=Methylocaldum sp. TaxID=1969727 RepID=UPI002D563836|nr:aminoglycoside phosphotransferase family protein [Methylocaldum sp.]HYE36368.1 aminoglycoside phosphotransferase family protein [Methylocaldum sp.]
MAMDSSEIADRIARHFVTEKGDLSVKPLGDGLINDTFLVTEELPDGERFVLQRINSRVFPEPRLIMENLRILLSHVRERQAGTADVRDLKLPEIRPTRAGLDFWADSEGDFWRALSFIPNTGSHNVLHDSVQAEEAGYALGRFHALTADLDPGLLHDTLPGFHIAPRYLARFEKVAAGVQTVPDSEELRFALDFVGARRSFFAVLEDAALPLRVIHGDPKLNNVLFDEHSGLAASLIDLDTVKPGLVHYDLGDCLRSCCNRSGEAADDASTVAFDLDVCRAILRAYFAETGAFLTAIERRYLYDAIRLLPLELGLRFLTDHLEGNRYFKVERPGQNLQRALVQFRLAESVETQEKSIRRLIDERA